ncbi:MAG: type II toxin-antitoxin system VapC family toxin [Candidatus Korarchaeota archaeon]|nr:type II toxin-antitoxin system VapC family toxin [Candidatus Korarchaeota archaeon]NIU85589.1 PIN domain protein [Candidatus Thorarchaeota archaeon]NIW15133.1 PIN domain protein [Candidatus Thorarchaeota archaeon]NIW53138.1 PIN domain protein [Candidatus Korarchaeota archaeon]
MKLRVYVDTSVIGGCFDEEFKEASTTLLDTFKRGKMTMVLSELTKLELQGAPKKVQAVLEEIPMEHIKHVELTEETVTLARHYIDEGVIGEEKLVDAEHIAIATVTRVDVLVSWNFSHIVNLQRIRGFNAVNLKYGYPPLEIRSPREVISYEA